MGPRDGRGPITHSEASPRRARVAAPGLILLFAAIWALALSGRAAATASCGKAVLDDWFENGSVDLLYDLPCYGAAIDAIPPDIRDYTDAEEVISRALQAATRGRLARPGVDPPSGGMRWSEGTPAETSPPAPPVDGAAAAAVDPSGASSLPIPLLVLGWLSLALLAAGAASYVSRRRADANRSSEDPVD